MNRKELEKYISNKYKASGEFLWAKYPEYEVFRHSENKKWFAIIMNVSSDKLETVSNNSESQIWDILDIKCDTVLIGSFLKENGFFPAYHMNKNNWLSIAINQVDDEKIKVLLDMSYELTKPKKKKVK